MIDLYYLNIVGNVRRIALLETKSNPTRPTKMPPRVPPRHEITPYLDLVVFTRPTVILYISIMNTTKTEYIRFIMMG